MARKNPHIGSSLESWLDEEEIRDEVTAAVGTYTSKEDEAFFAAIGRLTISWAHGLILKRDLIARLT